MHVQALTTLLLLLTVGCGSSEEPDAPAPAVAVEEAAQTVAKTPKVSGKKPKANDRCRLNCDKRFGVTKRNCEGMPSKEDCVQELGPQHKECMAACGTGKNLDYANVPKRKPAGPGSKQTNSDCRDSCQDKNTASFQSCMDGGESSKVCKDNAKKSAMDCLKTCR